MTTARALFAVPEGLGALDMAAVSEAARAATLAQNRAGATRLEAAYVLVVQFTRAAQSEDEQRPGGRVGRGMRGWSRWRGRVIIWWRRVS